MPSPLKSLLGRIRTGPIAVPLLIVALSAAGVAAAQPGAAGARSVSQATASRATSVARPVQIDFHRATATSVAASRKPSASRRPSTAPSTQPLGPNALRRAYGLPAKGARGQTIAIVSAYDDPNAQADLNAYDSYYSLPRCTTANHCFRVLNEHGQASPLPGPDASGGTWTGESAAGTEVAHGICTTCRVILVEANTPSRYDFSTAVATAAKAGATVIVTTFTVSEDGVFDPRYAPDYRNDKAVTLAAAGDAQGGNYGYFGGANFPSSLPGVLAVGGTHLNTTRNGTYLGEQAWSQTVSGCSAFQPAARWQRREAKAVGCQTRRAVADLAAEADPGAVVHARGIAGGPWFGITGTSLAAPIVGGIIGLAGSHGSHEVPMIYAHAHRGPSAFHDITVGEDAPGCTTAQCRAGRGFDGPTGWGTPDGLAAFLASGGALSRSHPRVAPALPGRGLRASKSWHIAFMIRNQNPFAVRTGIALRRRMLVGGRWTTVVFASGRVIAAPLSSQTVTLTINRHWRALLRQLRSVQAYFTMYVRGPVKPTVKVTRAVSLSAP